MKSLKGFTGIVFTAILVIVILLSILIPINFSFSTGFAIQRKVELQQNLYLMKNALEGAGLYFETAAKYSTYQALYDYGVEEKNNLNRQSFEASVSSKIADNMNQYAKSKYTAVSEDYKIDIPDIGIGRVVVSPLPTDKINVKISPEKNIVLEHNTVSQEIRLVKSSQTEFEVQYPLLPYIDQLNPEKVNEDLKRAGIAPWKFSGDKKAEGSCATKDPRAKDQDVLDLFNKINDMKVTSLDDEVAKNRFAAIVEANMRALLDPVKLDKVDKLDIKIETSSCDTKTEDKCNEKEKAFYKTLSCKFKYTYSGIVKAEVSDKKIAYPVKTGPDTISFENLGLKLNIPIKIIWEEK